VLSLNNPKNKLLIQLTILTLSIILIFVILSTPSLFEFTWNQILRDLFPGTEYFFRIITELGGTQVYFAIFFTLFWAVNKDGAKSLMIVYASSNFVNYYAKSIIANNRPPQSEWILIGASHLSTPSGHAMSSTIYWGYGSIRIKKLLMWVFSIAIIVLVGLSRMYLGVHWFGDVLTGWLFGIVILVLVWIFEQPLRSSLSKYNPMIIYLGLALVSLIIMIFSEFFYAQEHNIGTTAGKMIGISIGLALEYKFLNFEINRESLSKSRFILRISMGLIIYLILSLVLYLIIPSDVVWLVAIEYLIIFIVGLVIWPLIFTKLNF